MWIPGYTKVDLGPDGGTFDEKSHPKGGLHTTEGSTLAGAEAAFKNYPPHLGYDPIRRIKHQYISLNNCSYAYRGSESDDEYIIQIEIVGFASQTHNWSDQAYKNIAEDVFKPLENMVGIPRRSMKFYGEDDGIVLASPDSPIRMSASELRNFSGWLGHQHVPAPDSHWDPGKFLIGKVFSFLGADMPLTNADADLVVDRLLNRVLEDGTWTGPGGNRFEHVLARLAQAGERLFTVEPRTREIAIQLTQMQNAMNANDAAILAAVQADANDQIDVVALASALAEKLGPEQAQYFMDAFKNQMNK